jgi:hypothetical protein
MFVVLIDVDHGVERHPTDLRRRGKAAVADCRRDRSRSFGHLRLRRLGNRQILAIKSVLSHLFNERPDLTVAV